MKVKSLNFIIVVMLLGLNLFAQNPIVKNIRMSDPHVRVFNDTIFLYSGHDSFPKDRIWTMKDWRIFSSTDIVNWDLRGVISPKENYMDDNSTDCWASDAATRNDKYYFYFSDRKRGVGIMTSDSPKGPFIDPLNKPLVAPMHDPTILIDDDENKTPYLIYGDKENKNGFHIAELNNDMISLAHEPRLIEIHGEEWENAPRWMDKNYIFKHSGTYYLSWGAGYAVSNNIYGPYKCVGKVGNGHHLNEYAHGSFFKWKGQFYHIWCYYLKSGFNFRESIISYCHMSDNGEIVTDTHFLDTHFSNGVGRYNATWNTIEAGWFYEISGNIHKKGNKEQGFSLTNIKNGNWIKFANITFEKRCKKSVVNLKFKGGKGELEIRSGTVEGKVLGCVKLEPSTTFNKVNISVDGVFGETDIYFVFKGNEESTLEMDWLKFK